MEEFSHIVHSEGLKILLVLGLSFLLGLEREEHKVATESYAFGGVRSFPLIGLIGYSVGLLSGAQVVPLMVGMAAIGALLSISYYHKLATEKMAGLTTELSGLIVYLVGVLVSLGDYWVASTLVIASLLLLEFKIALENLARRIPYTEIFTFTKFLLLTAVILPLLPNEPLSEFQINPFKVWLVAVTVSGVSYGSYVFSRLYRGKDSVLLAAVVGGAYSSTVTTVALAKQARTEGHPHLLSGGILMASGIMYFRLAILLGFFNGALLTVLAAPFFVLGSLATAGGYLWSRRQESTRDAERLPGNAKNPLELRAAVIFAVIFVGTLVATHLALTYLGRTGVFSVAAIMGITDVDPFIMGMTQSATPGVSLVLAAQSILIAAASNNLVKGIYAYSFADAKTGRFSLMLLAGLAVAGLLPLLWI